MIKLWKFILHHAARYCALIVTLGSAYAQESFEAEIPPENWKTNKSAAPLAISDRSSKHGTRSLRWDWEAGDEIRVTPSDTLNFQNARGVDLWIFCEAPLEGELQFRIETGRGTYTFPMKLLGFRGWRAVYVAFDRDLKPQDRKKGARMTITAPDTGAGTILIDSVFSDGKPLDIARGADPHLPFINEGASDSQWPGSLQYTQLPRPTSTQKISAQQQREFAAMRERFLEAFAFTADWPVAKQDRLPAGQQKKFDALNLTGIGFAAKGNPIGHPKRATANIVNEERYSELVKQVALHWHRHRTADNARMFLQLFDHLQNQGYGAQSSRGNINHGTWHMRFLGSAFVLTQELLAETGRLEKAREQLAWLSSLDIIFEGKNGKPGEVHNRIATANELRLAAFVLMPDDDPMKPVYAQTYSQWQTRGLACTEGLRGLYNPDYSSYFHGGYNPGYQVGDVARTMNWALVFSGTRYESPELLKNLRKQFQALEFTCATYQSPLPLHNRNPFTPWSSMHLLLEPLAKLAIAQGEPILGHAARRLSPPEMTHKLAEKGIAAGPPPRGFLPLNFGASALHRRGGWLVAAKGYSRYLWAQEAGKKHQAGRYLSNGSLFIHAGGSPISQPGSGYAPAGFDWSHIPGATGVALPSEQLLTQKNEHKIYSQETFCGGTHMDAENGIFGLILNDNPDPSFRARKSYFFFDHRIICLGSGISSKSKFPTHTTLYQNILLDQPPTINIGKKLITLNDGETIPLPAAAGTHQWITDAQGHAYILPPNQAIHLTRQSITSQNPAHARERGDSLLAWIDHGARPQNARYEYSILINGKDQAETFAKALDAEPSERPYLVRTCTDAAHIVTDTATDTTGYVLFEAGPVKHGILTSVSHPCLIMIRPDGDGYRLTLCDPDLNIDTEADTPRKRPITITLAGIASAQVERHHRDTLWETDYPEIESENSGGNLQLTIPCRQARTAVLSLKKR